MSRRAHRSPLAWLGGVLALYLTLPILAFAIRLAGSNDRGFGNAGLWGAFRVSVESATISTLIVAVLGIPLAHWLARATGPVATVVGALVHLPLALPPVMSGIILIYVVGPYTTVGRFFGGMLTGSVTGIVLAQTFVAAPFLIIAARSAFATVDPALEDLAATMGHHALGRFFRVALPVASPGIRAGLLLTWMRALGEYGATVLLAYHPYSMPVYTYVQFSGSGLPTTQAPTALALAAAAVVVLLSQLRRPARLRPAVDIPAALRPPGQSPTAIGFDIDVEVGTFRLHLAHTASSHRIAVLGASGSGKSIMLRALAGLLGPEAGAVTYGGRAVTGVATEDRRIGYVPQGLGLLPGRTVWQQVTFATDADPSVAAWWLATLRLDELENRLPQQLSGGQRQRVALAAALAHNPTLVLLDEPFSALDAPVRDELRHEVRRLQRESGLSTVLVTHDPAEAALLADEILVIADGRLIQAGPRAEVFDRPASPQAARLLGIQNLAAGVVTGPDRIDVGGMAVTVRPHGLRPGSNVVWCIRPDLIALTADGPYHATVTDAADLGTASEVSLRLDGGTELRARSTGRPSVAIGSPCRLALDPEAITLWPARAAGSGVPAARRPR